MAEVVLLTASQSVLIVGQLASPVAPSNARLIYRSVLSDSAKGATVV